MRNCRRKEGNRLSLTGRHLTFELMRVDNGRLERRRIAANQAKCALGGSAQIGYGARADQDRLVACVSRNSLGVRPVCDIEIF